MENDEDSVQSEGLSRHQVLRRGAVVGATAAWTIPLVPVVSMTPAYAASPSAPGGGSKTPSAAAVNGSRAPQPPSGRAPGRWPPGGLTRWPLSTPPGSAPVSADRTVEQSRSACRYRLPVCRPSPAVGIGAAAITLGAPGSRRPAQIRRNRPNESAADAE